MKRTKFVTGFKDTNNGDKIRQVVQVDITDLTKDLGSKFLFVEVEQHDGDRVYREQISLPVKAIKKLIKAIRKVA